MKPPLMFAVPLLFFAIGVLQADETDSPGESSPGEALIVEQPAFFASVKLDRPDGRYREGDTMTVSFQLEKEAYAWLLYHQADGSCLLLFPNQAHPDNRTPAGQTITLPDPRLKYRFRVRPPFGEESLQVIASTSPIEELAAIDVSQARAARVPAETLAKLAERMNRRSEGIAEHRVRMHTQPGDQPLPEPRPARRAALCFGTSKYLHSDRLTAYPRYKNAPLMMAELFAKHGGVAQDNVRVLIDEQATRENFKQAITEWLPGITEPGDTVFIFFHGHGGPVKNQDGSEADGYDEFLTTYDTHFEAVHGDLSASVRQTAVVDDALARWLQELPGRQIVLLVDTCHGGGLVDQQAGRFGHDEARRVGDVTGLNTVVVSAGLADEVTFSTLDNSFLTLALQEAATSQPRPLTVRQAFDYFKRYLTALQSGTGFAEDKHAQEPIMTDEALLDIALFP